jgi:hypothetical protein
MKRTSIAVAVALMTMAMPLQAQTGLYVGAQVTGASLSYKDAAEKLDFGSGFGVHAGLTLGSSLGVLVNYDKNTLGSSGGDTDLGQWDLLARFGFMGIGPVKTYLTGGITGRAASAPTFGGGTGDYDFSGTNPTAGAAAQLFVTNKVAIDGSVLWTFGKFGDTGGYSASRVEATGSRVSVGASWYLFGGK